MGYLFRSERLGRNFRMARTSRLVYAPFSEYTLSVTHQKNR